MEDRNFISGAMSDAKEYVDLRIDEVKYKTVGGLSTSLARIVSSLVVVVTLNVALLLLAFALVLLLGKLIGDYAYGALIVAAVFIVVFIVLYALRKKMFRRTFVKLFTGIFFEEEKSNIDKEHEENRLAIVRKEQDFSNRYNDARMSFSSFVSGTGMALSFLKGLKTRIKR